MKLLPKAVPFVFAGIIIFFAAGLFRLFDLVFERGEVYPHYSTFRSDPLGARAVYESMGRLEGIHISRNLQPLTKLPEGRNKTLIFCGANLSEDPENVIKELENFAADGGRLAITFFPVTDQMYLSDENEECQKCPPSDADPNKDESGESDEQCTREECKRKHGNKEESQEAPWYVPFVSIEDRWGFAFETMLPPKTEKEEYLTVTAASKDGPAPLPQSVLWHSALYFDDLADPWKVLYAWDNHPVIAERKWGRGSIILCSDSYFLSNEAMRRERYPELIAYLVDSSEYVIFDETHLGIQQRQGVMSLARKYKLEFPLVVLLVLALLFVWRNALSLVPKRTASDPETGRGKDSTAGLINLLRRSISQRKVLQVCVEEWERSRDPKFSGKEKRVKEILGAEHALPVRQRNPVQSYVAINKILEERD